MTDGLIYNVPVSLIKAYRGRKIIVRSPNPSEITKRISDGVPEELGYIRILCLDGAIDDLKDWGPGIPVDLVVRDPGEDLPRLYRYASLLSVHPLRVWVPLVPGFGAIVRLSASLNFAVKVEGGQPDQALAGELLQIAHYYLHRTTVSEPIDFFHSLFRAFYHRDPVTLWVIQEEDPSLFGFVTDLGEETMPGRLAGGEIRHGFSSFAQEWRDKLLTEKGDCAGCEFLSNCLGYFKWPRRAYCCDGVQAVMRTRRDAAEDLRRDVASFHSQGEGGLMSGRHFSLILLPTLECNADCEYCFEQKSDQQLMLDQLEVILEKILDYLEREHIGTLSIYWQGGEVMTMPPEWFEQVQVIIRKKVAGTGKRVVNYLQSNLIGYNRQWNRVLAEMFGNSVGTSMDFPNLHRRQAGSGPLEYERLWIRKVNEARDAGIRVGFIAVPNTGTLEMGAERFYSRMWTNWGFANFRSTPLSLVDRPTV